MVDGHFTCKNDIYQSLGTKMKQPQRACFKEERTRSAKRSTVKRYESCEKIWSSEGGQLRYLSQSIN